MLVDPYETEGERRLKARARLYGTEHACELEDLDRLVTKLRIEKVLLSIITFSIGVIVGVTTCW